MNQFALSVTLSLALLSSIRPLQAQPAEPFQPDEHTIGLWHFDFCEPTEEWRWVRLPAEDAEAIWCVDVSNEGDYYLGGSIVGPQGRSLVVKLNAIGEIVWTREYGANGSSASFDDLVCLEDGSIALFGQNTTEGDERDLYAWLLIVDSDGGIVNSCSYDDFDNQDGDIGPRGRCMLELLDGFLLAGTDSHQTFVCRTNSEGEIIWQRSLGGNGLDVPGNIIKVAGGGFLMAGFWDTAGERDGWAVKLSGHGDIQWEHRYGDDIHDSFSGAVEVNDLFIFAGGTNEQIGPYNRWLLCSDQMGEVIWTRELESGKFDHPVIAWTGELVSLNNHGGVNALVKYSLADMTISFTDTLDFKPFDLLINDDQSYTIVGRTLDARYGSVAIKTHPDIPLNADYSANRLQGIIHGNAAPAEGRWGQALNLPVDEEGCMIVRNVQEIHLQNLAIECFFRMNGDAEHRGTLVGKGYGEESESFRLFTDNEQDLIGFSILTDAGLQQLTCQINPADEQWHYIRGVFSDGVMRLHFDGEIVGEVEVEGAILYNDNDLVIGSRANDPGITEPFWGLLDELRISGSSQEVVHPSQLLHLHSGWNIYSLYVEPEDADIRAILEPLVERGTLVRIKDSAGRFYVPARNFCNMPAWDYHQGYQILMAQVDSLSIEGTPVAPDTPIQLRRGWNMAAYFPEAGQSAQDAFSNLGDRLIFAKDGDGRFYAARIGFSNMGNLSRGFGYQINVAEGGEFIWHNPE